MPRRTALVLCLGMVVCLLSQQATCVLAASPVTSSFAHPDQVNLVFWPGAKLSTSSVDPTHLRDPFSGQTWYNLPADAPAWIQLNLPQRQHLNRIKLVTAGDGDAESPRAIKSCRIWVGDDAQDMSHNTLVKEISGNRRTVLEVSFPATAGKVLRVELLGQPQYSLSGFAAFSVDQKPLTAEYPISNIASNAAEIEPISGWWHGVQSRGGVSLLADTRVGATNLLDEQYVWVRVDGDDAVARITLNQCYTLERLRLGWYTASQGCVPARIKLALSVDDINYHTVLDAPCPQDKESAEFTLPQDKGRDARYVRFIIPKDPAHGPGNPWVILSRLALYGRPQPQPATLPTETALTTLATVDVPAGARLSAGIFDPSGRLVRTLHALASFTATRRPLQWDGLDDFGGVAPAGNYEWRTITSTISPKALPSIGNTGEPPYGVSCSSKWVTGIAFDAAGNWYQTASWDESGKGVRRYNADGSAAWVANHNGSYAVASDGEFVYVLAADIGGQQRGQRVFRVRCSDGTVVPFPDQPNGMIEINPPADMPTPPAEQRNLTPQQQAWLIGAFGLAVRDDVLYVGNYRQNRIERRQLKTGKLLGVFAVSEPTGIAVDPEGHLWVANSGGRVDSFTAEGKSVAAIEGLKRPFALAIGGPDSLLYITENGAGRVLCYDRQSLKQRWARGQARRAGLLRDDDFQWQGGSALGVSPSGRYLVSDPVNQRVQCFNADGSLYRSLKADFAQPGPSVMGEANPSLLLSGSFQYQVDLASGAWKFTHNWMPVDEQFASGSTFRRRLGNGRDYLYYFDTSTWGFVIYAIDSAGNRSRRSAILGRLWTGTENQLDHHWKTRPYNWTDSNGDGKVQESEVVFVPGELGYFVTYAWVDSAGNIWICNLTTKQVEVLKVQRFDEHDNPVYDWTQRQVIVSKDQMLPGFEPNLVRPASPEGDVYLIGTTPDVRQHRKGAGLYHQGGFSVVRHARDGRLLGQFNSDVEMVSFTTDGTFAYLASNPDPQLVNVCTPDGLVVARLMPGAEYGWTRGWMDTATPLAALRVPQTDTHHVYTEEVYYSQLLHYVFDAGSDRLKRAKGNFVWPSAAK